VQIVKPIGNIKKLFLLNYSLLREQVLQNWKQPLNFLDYFEMYYGSIMFI